MIYKVDFRAMGCQMSATLETSEAQASILEQVPGWFEEWENSLSRFRADSELNQLNQAPGRVFQVSETLWDVLNLSQKMYQRSQKLVTPVILDALELAGYDRSFEKINQIRSDFPIIPPLMPDLETIEMIPSMKAVILPVGMRLDLGGVAKGWAAHHTMLRLRPYGSALVDAGGDIACSGPMSNVLNWPISIRDPLDEKESAALLQINQHGVATSGKDFRRWKRDGHWNHHIIDPRTGYPAETDLLAVTVVAPDVMLAEMAAKTIFILGLNKGLKWIENNPDMAVFAIPEDNHPVTSPNMQSHLWRMS